MEKVVFAELDSILDFVSVRAINSAFIKSAISECNELSSASQIAILGRSNVGKSTFINTLLSHRLAKSSSTPGKTRLINFFQTTFEIKLLPKKADIAQKDSIESKFIKTLNLEQNELQIPFIIIDLPGFGYAKVDKKTKQNWDKNLSAFLAQNRNIKLFCHLIDARHKDLEIDKNIKEFLESILRKQGRNDCKILNIYTKADKLKKNELAILRKKNMLCISSIKKDSRDLRRIFLQIVAQSLGIF